MWEQNIKEESRLGCFEFFKRELCLNDTYIKDEEMINQELAKRDPINESDVEINEAMKSVARLSRKFCPMPRGPVDNYDLFTGYENFAPNIKWGWFHHQEKKRRQRGNNDTIEEEDDEFVMTPWYKGTDRKAPRANPQIEAGLEGLREFLFNPQNRRRMSDNMSPEDRKAMLDQELTKHQQRSGHL